jgi:hypothetical protein
MIEPGRSNFALVFSAASSLSFHKAPPIQTTESTELITKMLFQPVDWVKIPPMKGPKERPR